MVRGEWSNGLAAGTRRGEHLMEPYNIHPQANPDGVRTEALVSIAVSLKRIADMMEREYPPREINAPAKASVMQE